MSKSFFNSDYALPFAIALSAGIHAIIIAAMGNSPFETNASVLNAPNSIEINVIRRPLVSVIENEIISEEIIPEALPTNDEIVISNTVQKAPRQKSAQLQESSREIRGAITKARPMMEVNPAPLYPKLARQKGWEGVVRLEAIIEKDGSPQQVGVAQSSGYRILDRAAVKTVQKWKFSPAQSGNARLSSRISIPIRFDLIESP